MSRRRFLITSALPYSNGRPHVGHVAGAYLPADIYVRYLRSRGDEVRFICGSDDNGVASLISARKEKRTVAELTASYNARQKEDFEGLGIEFDIWGGTHQPEFVERHVETSQAFFRRIEEQGYFVKKTTEQLFDIEANQFLPDRYVRGGCYHTRDDGSPCGNPEADGDQCESCGKDIDPMQLTEPLSTITGSRPEPRETTHWHLQLQRLEEPLRRWLEERREADPPWRDLVLNFSLGRIRDGLPERAMTRDLDWGVPVPLDDPDAEGKVLYVWFDAPIGYVSFTSALCEREGGSASDYARWWKDPDCRIVHFIGEDNIVFHALIWPAMLMAEGSFQLPWQVVANAFVNIRRPGGDEEKISKRRGNAIWIEEYLKTFDADPLRYYLTAIAPESRKTTFEMDDFVARNNGELLATLGNVIHRTMTFVHRYFEGRVPETGERDERDREQLRLIEARAAATTESLEAFRFRAALGEVMQLARGFNRYFDDKQPWKQRKEDPAACGATLNVCVQTVRALATLAAPFLPFAARRCAAMLGAEDDPLPWDEVTSEVPPGRQLGEAKVLFRKIEPEDLLD